MHGERRRSRNWCKSKFLNMLLIKRKHFFLDVRQQQMNKLQFWNTFSIKKSRELQRTQHT